MRACYAEKRIRIWLYVVPINAVGIRGERMGLYLAVYGAD